MIRTIEAYPKAGGHVVTTLFGLRSALASSVSVKAAPSPSSAITISTVDESAGNGAVLMYAIRSSNHGKKFSVLEDGMSLTHHFRKIHERLIRA